MFHLKALKAVLLFRKSSFWIPILAAEGPYLMKSWVPISMFPGPY